MAHETWKIDPQELRARRGKTHIDPNIQIADVRSDEKYIWLELTDGRVIGAPRVWSPVFQEATPEQLARWELMPTGTGVYFPEVDEYLSARVLMGHPS